MKKQRETISIITPENISITLPLSSFGDRVGAFITDFFYLIILTVGLFMCLAFMSIFLRNLVSPFLVETIFLLSYFFLWNGYFIYFELKNGSTPGKTKYNFKVISQDGSFLPASSIYVRNLLREVEIWIPLKVLLTLTLNPISVNRDLSLSYGGFSYQSLMYIWILLMLLYPYFDPYNRRIGDLLAGTVVVIKKQASLKQDLIKVNQSHLQGQEKNEARFKFTDKMLDVYGKDELQFLEDILRQAPHMNRKQQKDILLTVVLKISRKIGFKEKLTLQTARSFLRDFYESQRKYLEKKLLHGQSLERKTKRRTRK